MNTVALREFSSPVDLKVGDWVQVKISYGVMGRPFYSKEGDYYRTVTYKRVEKVNKKSFTVLDNYGKPCLITKDISWKNRNAGIRCNGKFVCGEDYPIVEKFNQENDVEYFDV